MMAWPLLFSNGHPIFLTKRHFVCMGILQSQHGTQPARPLQSDTDADNHATKNVHDVIDDWAPDNTSWIEGAYQINVAYSGVNLEHFARAKGHLRRIPQ